MEETFKQIVEKIKSLNQQLLTTTGESKYNKEGLFRLLFWPEKAFEIGGYTYKINADLGEFHAEVILLFHKSKIAVSITGSQEDGIANFENPHFRQVYPYIHQEIKFSTTKNHDYKPDLQSFIDTWNTPN